ncbi:L-type lectin-domain containing receptor kinase IV.2-like [Quercus lobata]|uniref:L-type lectin-domain containing receptor kinase IV.2-like n=1 Tax=Quercus lobata TaxID=97700 RepID=UPI00124546A1|nr:L-type lectin-domain containing receptor kinase IV.2-like [Quercus lobata]
MELIDSDTLSSSLPQGGLQRETLLGLMDLGKSTGGVIPSTGLEVTIKRVAQDSTGAFHVLHKIRNVNEILEEWEIKYGAHRFRYSELFFATRGFAERNLIGSGGFGKVYRGMIPSTGLEVAIKRVAQDSSQGMKEFVAEITSMGRLRHRNLVQLYGWCQRQDELLLVYDYVPCGSLDKLLFENDRQKKKILTWEKRYKILNGVAQALLYLHEECDQKVVHRDVKPSNVLIDANLYARLGDFGLARIYEHGNNSQTTHIVGTLGYMAPELTRTGKATTSTDVYGYGILMLLSSMWTEAA